VSLIYKLFIKAPPDLQSGGYLSRIFNTHKSFLAEYNSAVKGFRIKNPEERGGLSGLFRSALLRQIRKTVNYSALLNAPINPEELGVTNLLSLLLFPLSFPQGIDPTEIE
jgi:hypothetical protein